MNTFQISVLIGILGSAGIGLFVLGLNPKRQLHRYFFLTSLILVQWLLFMLVITLTGEARLLFWTRLVTAAALLLPLGFYILRLAIMKPGLTPGQLWHALRYHFVAALLLAALCQTPWVVRSAAFAGPAGTAPVNEYGWGFFFFISYFVVLIAGMVGAFRETLRTCTGGQRIEAQFLLLAWLLGVLFGLALYVVAIFSGNQEATQFLPLLTLILNGFTAYGIATKRILSVTEVLQRGFAYGLVVIVLVAAYWATLTVGQIVFRGLTDDPGFAAHLVAALVVAFLVVPTQRRMHVLSRRLFFAREYSGDEILARAGSLIQEIATETDLMANFVKLISEAFGASRAMLLRPGPAGGFRQVYPPPAGETGHVWRSGNALAELLGTERAPVTTDMLARMRPDATVQDARHTLDEADAALAVGGFLRNEMKTVLLLAAKRTGRIYDLRDQRALQLLCDQFAVALENANLYTAVQDGKIYNEILLNSLTSGIVAVDSSRRVTVFNLRAQELTGLTEAEVVGQPMSILPASLSSALEAVLAAQGGFRNEDHPLARGDELLLIRVSGAMFHSHVGTPLGALLVFEDLTLLRKMEEQIRRTDRLSSIGTLSAGMAHEIKNPLVTIKTFAQLLPDKHQDADFRHTFFDLVGQEVARIDEIVNRLLHFARPSRPSLKPISLHAVLENSLRLIEPQMTRNQIALQKRLEAARDGVEADAEQLNQTFVNLFLNALQAMGQGGVLSVRTSVQACRPDPSALVPPVGQECIRVDIQDTGDGIAPEHITKIFDPFFTTKERGVGLGLSVSHGIVQEHGGTIDVESRLGRGTVFHLQLPLRKEPKA